jgi:sugar lactone lactonase YvrE
VNAKGELFFTDIPNNKIHKVDLDGKVSVFAEETGGANGLMFDKEGNLFACANDKKEIVKYAPDGKRTVVLDDVTSNDIVIGHEGDFFFTDPTSKRVWHSSPHGTAHVVDGDGLNFPNGLVLTPDQSLLLVADTRAQMVHSYQVLPGGLLTNKQPYFHLHMPDTATESGADGMTVDTMGRLYVTTSAGLQVCDQAGRVNAIIHKPQRAWLSNVTFAGPELDTLVVTCGDKIYKRKTKAKGVLSWRAPFTPPAPRL